MKLRIQGNSLRLRLSRSEVERFGATGKIEDSIEFDRLTRLTYDIRTTDSKPMLVTYGANRIQVEVPRRVAMDWTGADQVSIAGEQPLDGGKTLQILIEKDFKCIHKDASGNEDSFPNPLAPELDD